MRKVPLVIILLAVCLFSCGKNPPNTTEKGPEGPGGVSLGMSRSEVIRVMLQEVQALQMSGRVTNPYATRYIKGKGGEPLEVMYYYTGMERGDNKVTDDELVPIILKNNAVVGWSWKTLEDMTGSRLGPEDGT